MSSATVRADIFRYSPIRVQNLLFERDGGYFRRSVGQQLLDGFVGLFFLVGFTRCEYEKRYYHYNGCDDTENVFHFVQRINFFYKYIKKIGNLRINRNVFILCFF